MHQVLYDVICKDVLLLVSGMTAGVIMVCGHLVASSMWNAMWRNYVCGMAVPRVLAGFG